MEILQFSAILHDIGKLSISPLILNKPGRLTPLELDTMKCHSFSGYSILKDVTFLSKSADIILQHHEWMNGKGYPKGLMGNELHVMAKVISVADAFDAMTTSRPYRTDPLSFEEAKKELLRGIGTQFDEEVVAAFFRVLDREK